MLWEMLHLFEMAAKILNSLGWLNMVFFFSGNNHPMHKGVMGLDSKLVLAWN
jgi:hypothetical protein